MTTPRVILGTMTFSDQTNEADAATIVQRFAEMPPSIIGEHAELDTARIYNDGATEDMLGRIISEKLPSEAVAKLAIATKANPRLSLSGAGVQAQMEDSMAALKGEECDIYYLHSPDADVPIAETLEAVQKLYEAKRFRRFGLSNYTAWEVVWIHAYMKEKGYVLPSVYQGMMNPLTRSSSENLLPALRRLNICFNLYVPCAMRPRIALCVCGSGAFSPEGRPDASPG